jgi:hypothetical protein
MAKNGLHDIGWHLTRDRTRAERTSESMRRDVSGILCAEAG